ncbi:WRKY domain [Sesbania bispinosa]|nr:WRKY domain [Sesbania bispinosa]
MSPMPIQILRWLMQPLVWRFVGFGSAVVGLLCYALSSSFNHLFGNWNLIKIFLYTAFSFIISLLIFYAKKWQHSTSLRFKAHSAFLVLTITSVYSFFYDKVVNGKPDAYSLISCSAFSIMTLSLSRQTRCGFEVDLLYFFLGCLNVQLMKIKLPLAILGAGFSYSLIILRSYFSSLNSTVEIEHLGLQDQRLVIQVDSSQQLANTDTGKLKQQFMNCVEELRKNNSNLTNMLLQRVKKYLNGNTELVVTDHNFMIDVLPRETMNNLHETAKLMLNAGLQKECSEVYSTWRKEWLEECLINKLFRMRKIGFQDYMIGRWIKTFKVSLRILFPSERRLCNHVFMGFSSTADLCFLEVCHGAAIQLLNYADAFVTRSPSAWLLFQTLDMFDTLREMIPDFESLFPDSLVNEAIRIQNRLGEASRDIFMEFGNLIFHTPDAEFDAWDDGRVHPMTCVGSGYLVNAFWSRLMLEKILREYPKVGDGGATSSFSVLMERIMEQIERKLEAKSKIYKDPALRCFFMMNNLRHIEYQLGTLWRDERFQANTGRYLELYHRSSWNKVLDILNLDSNNNESVASNVAVESMKDKLNLFNLRFREVYSVQSTWLVFDKVLRKQIIVYVENMLLPAYANFIGRFHHVLGEHADEYIEYGMSDIQDRLNHLFIGNEMMNQHSIVADREGKDLWQYPMCTYKEVNGKPDLLSLISCAAFALMSVCLSRQIDLGFGADLLNFFLGYFTVQLMKINLMLSIVAAILCYSLMVLRSKMDSQSEIGTQGLEHRVDIKIDAADEGDRGADHNRSHFQGQQIESLRRRMVVKDEYDTDYNNGRRQIHHSLRSRMVDDGYNLKKYEEKQVKKNENLRSYFKCASPRCPVRKKIETSIDGEIIETQYKGNHNHCKPKFTLKSNSSSEYLYSLLPSEPVVPTDMPDQSFASHGGEQLDGDATPENSTVSI